MAITKHDLEMWEQLKGEVAIPSRPRVLELGLANWYGDVQPPGVEGDEWRTGDGPFRIARAYYRKLLDYREIVAIDLNGPAEAHRMDLNFPLPQLPPFHEPFDIVINTGTSEHVFDQAQLFESVHNCTRPGGLMVHTVPAVWPEHGFYSYSACLFLDLAQANGYSIIYCCERMLENARLLMVAMKRLLPALGDGRFRLPMQRRSK